MIEVKINLPFSYPGSLDLVRKLLENSGVNSHSIVESKEKEKVYLAVYASTFLQAQRLKELIYSLDLKKIKVVMRVLRDSQWKTKWKEYFQPLNLTPGICIVPAWLAKRKIKTNRKKVFIDTSVAFGTGMHPTTQMTGLLIEQYRNQLGKFLDVGTGSGILSLIASVHGAKEIWALDIDKQAVETAKSNFKLNNCSVQWLKPVDFHDFKNSNTFDFVAANLITEDLIAFKDKLIAKVAAGGYLAVSGIFQTNYKKFSCSFKDRRLKCVKSLKRKGWHAAIFKKTKSP